jgi:hypothetical protein
VLSLPAMDPHILIIGAQAVVLVRGATLIPTVRIQADDLLVDFPHSTD